MSTQMLTKPRVSFNSTSRENMRVVVASEHPRVQYFLRELVEGSGRALVAGQADDTATALTLTRELRPDVVVIDFYLPHVVGLDGISLSRIGGLDVAQQISEDIPGVRVILVNNLDTIVRDGHALSSGDNVVYSIEDDGGAITLTPRQLASRPDPLVFASLVTRTEEPTTQGRTSVNDKIIFFGAVGIALGWLITLTIIFAQVGAVIAVAGAATVLFGLAGKLGSSLWHKLVRK
ncbi:MAG: hypothetical protein HY665_01425 [Chloroflexi bacterium]|nr:hypothetical protein [Chloroflexota bacterium]